MVSYSCCFYFFYKKGGDLHLAFTAVNFVYDNMPSEKYGLLITSIAGESVSPAGSAISLITDKVFRNPVQQLLGIDQEPLVFDVEFTSPKPLDMFEIDSIATWLTGQHEYKKLQIDQADLKNSYYNCIITNMSNVYYNNRGHSFRCTVECDAPWAWEFETVKSWQFPDSAINNERLFIVTSENSLIKPLIEFTLTDFNTTFSIVNHSLNGLEFGWTGLNVGETITVNCATQEISSSTGLFRSDKFNKRFLSLRKGVNNLEFRGTVKNVTFTYQNAKKVGG